MTSAIPWMNSSNLQQSLDQLLSDGSTVAYYKAGTGITGTLNASAWANQIGAAGSLAQASGANQPIVLPFTGEKYAYLPGVTSNNFTTPDSAANSITGDIDIRVKVAMDDWTPAAETCFISKWGSGGATNSWVLQVNTDGTLRTFLSTTGANTIIKASTAATGFTDATEHWVRTTVDVDNGASGYDVKFYTSEDGESWVQLGTTVTTATAITLFDPNIVVEVGTRSTGTSGPVKGKIYRAQIYNGISGTLVVDFNAADWSETSTNGATQVSSTTGETWTLVNTGALPAQIVGSPSLLFDGTADYMATGAATLDQPMTAYLVGRQITWTDNDVILDGATADTLGLKQTTTTPSISLNAGAEAAEDANLTLGLYSVITVVLNGASSSIKVNANAATTGNAGAGNPSGLVLGAVVTPGSYSNIQVKELIVRSGADAAGTQAKIQRLLQAIHGTP